MGLTVKICGLSTEETLDAALDAGADMVGFVFYPASPRWVTANAARELRRRVGKRAEVVALLVDMNDGDIAEIVEKVAPDWLQLHGREPPARAVELRERFGLPLIKAIGIRGPADVAAAAPYGEAVDRILFDAKPPVGAILPGGNGAAFNWKVLRGIAAPKPFMVAGGLDGANLREALETTGAMGVDVSSGVETSPGKKDPNLIRAFVAAARLADAMLDRREPAGAAG
jgi:phosphoribosylanthranilate isomerase